MTREELIANFDPNGAADHDGIFGLPFTEEHAQLVILPVPWEVTVSYGTGTAAAPQAIRKASLQVDLFDPLVPNAWKMGIWMAPEDEYVQTLAAETRNLVENYKNEFKEDQLQAINTACRQMVDWLENTATAFLDQGKHLVLLGGDHSTPLGYLKALAKRHENFAILQIDAHADLRDTYEGFEYSHASIMFNALKIPQVHKLVQVGVRDYCEEEADLIEKGTGLIRTFFDHDIKRELFKGKSWHDQVEQIISHLPDKVYLSFDIDGLDPKLCPNTGTPVPGGLQWDEVLYLFERMVDSGCEIIGMDLNEVGTAENEWDANVGARLLWRMCNLLGKSQGLS